LATDPGTRRVIYDMMQEARAVGEALGVTFAVDTDERIGMAAKVGNHRSSMLQDVDAGRATELDCLLGAVIELAKLTGIATPILNLVYDLTKYRSRT
jgi:2-dehydropantoate 2-reductase